MQGGALGPNGKWQGDGGGDGNSRTAASPKATVAIGGGSSTALTAVCCAKAQTAHEPDLWSASSQWAK